VAFQREVVRLTDSPGMEIAHELRDADRDLVVGVRRDGEARGTFTPGVARRRSLQMFGSLHWMWTWFDDAWDEVGAMLQELRVSRFAQEVGTAGSVSEKRIEKALARL